MTPQSHFVQKASAFHGSALSLARPVVQSTNPRIMKLFLDGSIANWFAIADPFIYLPNAAGLTAAMAQLGLYARFGDAKPERATAAEDVAEEEAARAEEDRRK